MKKTFEGLRQIVNPFVEDEHLQDCAKGTLPPSWEERTASRPFLHSSFLQRCRSRGTPFFLVSHPDYRCCEYEKNMNLFSFGKQALYLPFAIIGPPSSVDAPGYDGNLKALVEDYRRRKGNFLMLNLRKEDVDPVADMPGIVLGRTLSSCVLDHSFASMAQYLEALRSPYRYRLHKAQKKGASLQWRNVKPKDFDEALYRLYLQVLQKSDFPLETLGMAFFRQSPGKIHALYRPLQAQPLAFVMTESQGKDLFFLFGGMDYRFRDEYDLYFNMLLRIVEEGIQGGYRRIHFGQTAEQSKLRLGCSLEDRYMLLMTSCPLLHLFAKTALPLLEYKPPKELHRPFRCT